MAKNPAPGPIKTTRFRGYEWCLGVQYPLGITLLQKKWRSLTKGKWVDLVALIQLD